MIEKIQISLVGAKSYGTLTTVYQQGEPVEVTPAVWEFLRVEQNPSTGAPLFCLTSDLPPEPPMQSPDLSAEDLRASGLIPEIDTGVQYVENTVDILQEDSEDFPAGAPDGSATGEVLLASTIDEDAPDFTSQPASASDAQTADTGLPTAPKKLTIGGKSKAVTV